MIIGLVGPKGSGKSTRLAAALVAQHNFTRMPLAGPLKAMIRTLLRERGVDEETIERMVDGDFKEEPTPYFAGRSTRYAMQTIGTEWGRDLIAPTFWLDTWSDKARSVGGRIVADDVRFLNEAERIRTLGGIIVRVVRPDTPATVADVHSSETEMTRIDPDHVVINFEGDPPEALVTQLVNMGVL